MSTHSRPLVFFLGAGFSAHAGLPTMVQFGGASRSELEEARKSELDKRRHKGRDYAKAGRLFEEFRLFCERAKPFVQIDADNMEEVFCMAEAMREAKVLNVTLPSGKINLDELLRNIRIWLWKIYQRNPSLQYKGNQKALQQPYNRFVSMLRDRHLWPQTTVLTTNYDLVFEAYAWMNGVLCTYPRPWIPLRVGSRYESYIADDDQDAPLILKLHGSVNFFAKPYESEENRLAIAVDVGQRGDPAIGKSHLPSSRPAIFAYDAEYALQDRYGPSLGDPAIIPPTYAKLRGFSWLRRIWALAFEALRDSEKIVFIGYSMPESDGFLRAMIRSAMAAREDPNPPFVYVFDPDPRGTVVKTYQAFFKSPQFIKEGFQDALPSIERLLT
jgi:hypothetical protein